ncbi:Helix-turn-helix domain containing protein [uncultured Caudovirales phage]|uniref:Helix-turn-helix domain containing protein n=1 Tax=uncultured Caudovirales phage TaxID=2100421 RepID=A0A6J5M720_9CAUD|nr:Helix-turn-helix domain containing protein [uncultured Caudovirales phage]CAB4158531.1 Helix-turn-helix domain containing protein [uncultured Caudovirales phage]
MTEIRSTEYFAIVPEWVVHADISANAVRLYAILNRFANSRGHAWPSRKTIADLMRVSVATVDRAKDELVELGALTVEARTTPSGDPSSNLYILHTSHRDKLGTLSPVREGLLTREGRGTVTGDALIRDSMKQRKEHLRACKTCLGKYRTGYDDGTEGLSHIWIEESRDHVVCPTCGGSGKDNR